MEPSKCNPLTFSTSALTFHSEKYAYIGIYDFIHCVRNDIGKGSKNIYIYYKREDNFITYLYKYIFMLV